MSELLINKSTKLMVDSLIKKLPQSILLTGEIGVGLMTIAKHIAEQNKIKPTILLPEKDKTIDIDKGVISVEMMRDLYDTTKSKNKSNNIIIIDYAEKMTIQAQNAFLKLLEEPNQGTHFILLSHSHTKLLPTILSRLEKITINKISSKETENLLDLLEITEKTKRVQLLFMAEGLPAEIIRLTNDKDYFDKRSSNIKDAKELIKGGDYQKLRIAFKYKDDRESALIILADVAKILRISLASRHKPELIKMLDNTIEATDKIIANGNIRLVLTKMIL